MLTLLYRMLTSILYMLTQNLTSGARKLGKRNTTLYVRI